MYKTAMTIEEGFVMNQALPATSQTHFFESHETQGLAGVRIVGSRFHVFRADSKPGTYVFPFWIIDFSYVDCGTFRIGKRHNPWLTRRAGDLHLYAPDTRFWERFPTSSPLLSTAFITFYGGENLDLIKHVQNKLGFGRYSDPDGQTGQWLAEAAVDAANRGESAYWFVTAKLLQIVDRIHAARQEDGSMIITPSHKAGLDNESTFAMQVRKHLQQRLNENVTVADLARHLNISTSSLAHKYRELTGEPPMKTLMSLRVNAVKNLLTKGAPLKSIAAQTGFYDEFHLSKVFKKHTGYAPSVYLKQIQNHSN